MHHIWWLSPGRRTKKLVTPSCRYQAGQWGRPTDLGSSLHSTIWADEVQWVCGQYMLCYHQEKPEVSGVHICGWYRPVYCRAILLRSRDCRLYVALSHTMGGTPSHHWGALVLEKYFWYLLEFEWHNGQWKYSVSTQTVVVLQVCHANNKYRTIDHLKPHEACQTLGVWLSSKGNCKAKLEHLKSVATEWTTKMEQAKLTHNNAMFSLKNMLMQKLVYPLMVTSFTEIECQTIMQLIFWAGLPKARVVRIYPRALVHRPERYAGLKILHLYTEQLITQVVTVLKYGTLPSNTTVVLLCASIEGMKLETGLQGELFDTPICVQHLLTKSWIKNVWKHNIQMQMSQHDGSLPHKYDSKITWLFLQNGYCAEELHLLNQCHMHLHAFWLLVICTGSVKDLSKFTWTGKGICELPWLWPVTVQPSTGKWCLWQQVLTKSLSLDHCWNLTTLLGDWLESSAPAGWYYEPECTWLWHACSDQWKV